MGAVSGWSQEKIQGRGRWAHPDSCKRYMKHGRYLKELSRLSKQQIDAAKREQVWLVQHLPALLLKSRKRARNWQCFVWFLA